MKKLKKTLCLLLSCLMLACPLTLASDAETNGTELKFNSDGTFKIMMFADIQDDEFLEETTGEFMKEVLDKYQPDLVIYLGDNTVSNNREGQMLNIRNITAPVIERDIPFAIVFGNHDEETAGVPKEELLEEFRSLGCLTYDAVPEMHGCGTCNLPILSSDGSKTAFNLWLTDSGDYNRDEGAHGYDYVHPDTIEWYKETAAALAEQNGGEPVPAMNFQHIVIPEIYDAISVKMPFANDTLTYEYFGNHYFKLPVFTRLNGYWLEECCPPSVYDGQLDAWVETGDVIAAFHGHDHNNSYQVNISGVDVINVPTAGCSSYCKDVTRGAGLITLYEDNPLGYDYQLVHFYDFALDKDSQLLNCDGAESKAYYAFYKALDTLVQLIFKFIRIFAIDKIC